MDDFDIGEHKVPYQRLSTDPLPVPPTLIIPPPSTSSPITVLPPLPSSIHLPHPHPQNHHPPPEHPVVPIADPGSGAHDNCSATCVLSHPTRSATLYLACLYSIVTLATLLLILVKVLRGDAPTHTAASDAAASAAIAFHTSPLPDFGATNLTLTPPLPPSHHHTTAPLSPLPSPHDLLHSLESTLDRSSAIHTLASVTPKVPDDGDMVSAMIMLMWGLSPLVSAVLTISWTYYTYRDKEDAPGEGGERVHTHHHHPRLVNPSPPLSSDEVGAGFQLFPPSVGQGSPAAHPVPAVVEEEVVTEQVSAASSAVLPGPPRNVRSQTAVVTPSIRRSVVSPSPASAVTLTPTVAASPNEAISPTSLFRAAPPMPAFGPSSRSVTAPSAPVAHVEAVHTRCRRPHTVHPFYSRVSPPRPRWWFVPTSRQHFLSLCVPAKRFLIRCYFLPILIPTVAAVVQYVFSGALGFTGWLSSEFVPTLTEALSLPVGNAGEVWAVVLSFFYELFFGCWWDPFRPALRTGAKG